MIIFIPIKENSLRVNRKNFRLVDGIPLYKHVLRKLKSHDVFVSTDSKEIMNECSSDASLSHVTCYERNSELCGDRVSVCDILKDFVLRFDVSEPVLQMHVTSPLLSVGTLEEAYQNMKDYDSVVSCNIHQVRFWRKGT